MALEILMLCGSLYRITGTSVELDVMGQSHSKPEHQKHQASAATSEMGPYSIRIFR
jgi:hypothetical protein